MQREKGIHGFGQNRVQTRISITEMRPMAEIKTLGRIWEVLKIRSGGQGAPPEHLVPEREVQYCIKFQPETRLGQR